MKKTGWKAVLAWSWAAALLLVMALGAAAQSAQELRVGLLAPLTGSYAPVGSEMVLGFQMYLEEVGHRFGPVAVTVVSEDTMLNPGVALTKARKLVDSDGVHVLTGIVSAPATYAIRDYVEDRRVPTVVSVAAGDDVTQRLRAEYIVRLGWGASSQTGHPFGAYVAGELNYRRVVIIADDFAFGHEWVGGFERTFTEAGGTVVRKLWVPLGSNDFSPYLAQIPSDVDAVVAAVVGPPAIRFIKQYEDFGFKAFIPLVTVGHMTDESILTQMSDEASGIVSVLHYSSQLDNPENAAFVQAFRARFGKNPSAYAEAGYTTALWLDRAISSLGRVPSDPAELLAAIKAVGQVDAPRGPLSLDAYGNAVQNVYVRRVERVGGQLVNRVIQTFPAVSQFWTWDPEEYLQNPVYAR